MNRQELISAFRPMEDRLQTDTKLIWDIEDIQLDYDKRTIQFKYKDGKQLTAIYTPSVWDAGNYVSGDSRSDLIWSMAEDWIASKSQQATIDRLTEQRDDLLNALKDLESATRHFHPCQATMEKCTALIAEIEASK